MGVLDGFELVSEASKPFITLRERTITFSKSSVEELGFPAFVLMYVNRKERKVAFRASENTPDSIAFYKKPKEGLPVLVRISDKKKASMLAEIAGVEASDKGIRFYGEFFRDEKIICFDLSEPVYQ